MSITIDLTWAWHALQLLTPNTHLFFLSKRSKQVFVVVIVPERAENALSSQNDNKKILGTFL